MSRKPDWFLYADLKNVEPGEIVTLDAQESIHAKRVKRHGVGSEVELFDGMGCTAAAVIKDELKKALRLQVQRIERHGHGVWRTQLVYAIPKGDRMETVLDMTTQLGVTRLTPVEFSRSTPGRGGNRTGRWARVITEACKQSRRSFFPRIDPPCSLSQWLRERTREQREILMLADPCGRPAVDQLIRTDLHEINGIVMVVGPEGGLEPQEVEEIVSDGFEKVALGKSILRIETAAVALCTLASLFAERASGYRPA